MLQVFKDSETDDTYQNLLAKHTADERHRIEKFVDGEDPKQISDGFVMGPSLGCREELEKLREAETIVHVSASGIEAVKGSIDLVETAHDWFHSIVNKLAGWFGVHLPQTAHIGGILVSVSRPAIYEMLMDAQIGIQKR